MLLASSIAVGTPIVLKTKKAKAEFTMRNDVVTATDNVNMRLGDDIYEDIICQIKKDEIINRILSRDNGWDLVIYKDKIGFLCGDYVDSSLSSKEEVDSSFLISELNGYAISNDNINLRLGPSTDDKVIGGIKSGELAQVIGVITNGWYLVRYNDNIGYISGEFSSYLENLNNIKANDGKLYAYASKNVNFREEPTKKSGKIDSIKRNTKLEILGKDGEWYKVYYDGKIGYVNAPYIDFNPEGSYRDDFQKVVFAKESISLFKEQNSDDILYNMDKNEVCEVLREENGWYFVRAGGNLGYIEKAKTKDVFSTFVVVDISDQKLTVYKNNEILLESSVVTGKKYEHDTPLGIFSIAKKETDTYLIGEDYYSHVDYWMPFNGGIGLHDASWRNKFGGNIYENKGSHGCVNLPPDAAEDVYVYVKRGTKVIVQK